MNLQIDNYVVQANALVSGKQDLSLNETKLLRLVIMQNLYEDREFREYKVSIKKLAETFGISSQNLYRDIEGMCKNIISNPVYIKKGESWKMIPWVSFAEYMDGKGILRIKLNEELKPYVLGLQKCYTQYQIGQILNMSSVYAIRIFEMIIMKLRNINIPREGKYITCTVQELREACQCEDCYSQFGMFRKKVLDIAVREIRERTSFFVGYKYEKEGRKIVAIKFYINSCYNKIPEKVYEELKSEPWQYARIGQYFQ